MRQTNESFAGALVHLLVSEDGQVKGVRATLSPDSTDVVDVRADAVILTSGGFDSDRTETSLLSEYAPEKVHYATTNGAFAQGDGVKMGRAIGAKPVDMQYVQVHPTAIIDPAKPTDSTKFLAAEALRGKGAILVNEQGARFVNEMGRRDFVTGEINKHCAKDEVAGGDHVAYMIMDEEAVEAFGRPAFTLYAKIKKFFTKYDILEELLAGTSFDKLTFLTNMNDYTSAALGKTLDAHGRQNMPISFLHVTSSSMSPLYVAKITPAVHYTMDGLAIDVHTRVMNEQGTPIQGLFAAGEVYCA